MKLHCTIAWACIAFIFAFVAGQPTHPAYIYNEHVSTIIQFCKTYVRAVFKMMPLFAVCDVLFGLPTMLDEFKQYTQAQKTRTIVACIVFATAVGSWIYCLLYVQ